MKIIFLIDGLPDEIHGGASVSSLVLARGLKKSGHELLLIYPTSDRSRNLKKETLEGGVEIVGLYTKFSRRFRVLYSLYNPQILPVLESIFMQYRPDVVHAHNIANGLSYQSLRLARKHAKAVFFTARDTTTITYGKFWWYIDQKNLGLQEKFNYRVKFFDLIRDAKKSYLPFRNIFIRNKLNGCSAVFAISRELKKALEQNGIKNAQVVYNSVEIEKFDQITEAKIAEFKNEFGLWGRKVLFMAGRLSKYKGMFQLFDALALVKKECPEAILLLATGENYFAELLPAIRQKKIEDSVVCHGWLDTKKNKVAYRASDICVTPSIYLDPFNRDNIEAMAARKPVVGTCFGGTPEIVVNEKTGYIVNPYNFKLMAERIIELIKNPEKAREMGEAGYERVKKDFNAEFQAKETIQIYCNYLS